MNDTNRKLRILFATSDKYPPFRPAARVIFGEELVKRGHIIDWLIQAEKNYPKSCQVKYGNGVAYIAATDDGETRWARLKKHFLGIFNDVKIFNLAKNGKYDLIQVKDKYIAALIAVLAAKLTKTKFIYWLAYPHAEASLYEANAGIARYKIFYLLRGIFFKFVLYKIILQNADHIFVQSEQMRVDISKEGIPLDRMTPIPSSLSLKEIPYANTPAFVNADNNAKNIVYLGTLMRTRRLDFLIRVHAKVIKRHPTAKLFLVGKGEMPEDEQYLISEAKHLGILDSIVFAGFLPMKDAWEHVRNANVCVSPYYPTPILNSTSPTKLIEYMAMKKAVVGNDHPEQNLVISESGAGLCVPWDIDAFADAVSELLDNPLLARNMGIKGRKYVEQYRTNSVMATRVEEQYYCICDINRNPEEQRIKAINISNN